MQVLKEEMQVLKEEMQVLKEEIEGMRYLCQDLIQRNTFVRNPRCPSFDSQVERWDRCT
jgi:hypothetical protein